LRGSRFPLNSLRGARNAFIFQEIIVRTLVLHDEVLGIFTGSATYVPGNLSDCGGAIVAAGSLADCGIAHVSQLGSLIVSGIGILQGLLNALMAQ